MNKINYKSIFFSEQEIINLTFEMMMKFFKENKTKLKLVQGKKNTRPSVISTISRCRKKIKIKTCQLKNILMKQNLKFIKTLKDAKSPIIRTYLAKGNEGNIFFFITSSSRRISTQQIRKKINKITQKHKIKSVKTSTQRLILDANFFSPLLLVIFKKRDLRCSQLIFDSQILNKKILIPSLTKSIFVELKCSSFIHFLSEYVSHITYMNFPQQHS